MKGPSRATAVRGFVSVYTRYVIPCKVCNASIGRPCRVTRGINQGNITKSHHPRTSANYAQTEKVQPPRKIAKTATVLDQPKGWGAGYGTNSGHGQIWARPDYMKINCGGWRKCQECKDIREYCIRYPEKVGTQDQI